MACDCETFSRAGLFISGRQRSHTSGKRRLKLQGREPYKLPRVACTVIRLKRVAKAENTIATES